ncbi:MAG: hypothetical protein ACOYYU_08955 [Chloroflexota bacterium]
MPAFFYNLLNSSTFYVTVGIWILICLASGRRIQSLGNRFVDLTFKPIIFKPDSNPESVPIYPRGLFEDVAVGFKDALQLPFRGIINSLKRWRNEQRQKYSEEEKPFLPVGNVLFLLLTSLFIYLDIIAITQALVSIGLIDLETLWEPFNNYALAMAGGSIFAILISVFVLEQISSKKSDFSHWDKRAGAWVNIAKALINYLIIFGTLAVLLLGFQRLIALGFIPDVRETVELGVNIAISILVPLNTVLTTALIFSDGIIGFMVLVTMGAGIVSGIFYILDYIALILGYVLPFVVDISYRIILIAVNLIWFLIYTPINMVTSGISAPFRSSSPEKKD